MSFVRDLEIFFEDAWLWFLDWSLISNASTLGAFVVFTSDQSFANFLFIQCPNVGWSCSEDLQISGAAELAV